MLHSQWRGHMREVSDGILGKNKVFSSLGFPMFSLLIAPPPTVLYAPNSETLQGHCAICVHKNN